MARKAVQKKENNDGKELFEALRLLEAEKGIPIDFMIDKIKKAIVTACKNSYGNEDVVIDMDPRQGPVRRLPEKADRRRGRGPEL